MSLALAFGPAENLVRSGGIVTSISAFCIVSDTFSVAIKVSTYGVTIGEPNAVHVISNLAIAVWAGAARIIHRLTSPSNSGTMPGESVVPEGLSCCNEHEDSDKDGSR